MHSSSEALAAWGAMHTLVSGPNEQSCHPSHNSFCTFFPPHQLILAFPGKPPRLLPDSITKIPGQMGGVEADLPRWKIIEGKTLCDWEHYVSIAKLLGEPIVSFDLGLTTF